MRRLMGAGPVIRKNTLDAGAKIANDAMQRTGQIKSNPNIMHGQLQCIKLTSSDKVARECLAFWFRQMQDYDWSKPAIKDNNKFFVIAVNKNATHYGISVRRGSSGSGRSSGRYFVSILLDPGPGPNLKDSVKGYTGEEIKDRFMDNI